MFNKIPFIKILRKHWIVLLVALPVAFFMALPQLLFVQNLGQAYRGIPRFVDDDGWHYLVRARDTADGHITLGNPYLAEHKDKPSMQFFLPDWIEARFITMLGMDIPTGFLLLIPFFGFLNAILAYAATFMLTRSRIAALLVSVFLFLGMFAKTFNRPTQPSFTILFWFLEFYALLAFIRAERKTGKLYSANIATLGALFHVYPYFWSFYITVLGIIAFFATLIDAGHMAPHALGETTGYIRRIGAGMRRIIYSFYANPIFNLKHFLIILCGAIIIAIPYFQQQINASQLSDYHETLIRNGTLNTHFPSAIRIVIPGAIVLLAGLALLWRRIMKISREAIFILGGALGALVAANQHVITGIHMAPSLHYVDMGIIWLAISVAFLLVSVSRAVPKAAKVISVCAMGAVVLVSGRFLATHVRAYAQVSEGDYAAQRFADVFTWLGRNTSKDEVVFANSHLSLLVPVFTHNNIIFDRNANHFFMSNREVQERFLIQSYFEDVDEAYVRLFERSFFGVHYTDVDGQARQENKVRKLFGFPLRPLEGIPQAEIDNVLDQAEKIKSSDFESLLKKYHVTRLVWDTARDSHWQGIEGMPFLELIATAGDFRIYRVE